jgi:hypothetical protein
MLDRTTCRGFVGVMALAVSLSAGCGQVAAGHRDGGATVDAAPPDATDPAGGVTIDAAPPDAVESTACVLDQARVDNCSL